MLEKNKLSKHWVIIPISKISLKITDGEHIKPKFLEFGIPFVSAKDITEDGISFENVKYISNHNAKLFRKKCDPEQNDLLMVSRGNVGKTCLITTDNLFCLLGSVILLKLNKAISLKYILYFLRNQKTLNQLIKISSSTVQGAIYLRDLKKLNIPLAPSNEQKRIVAKIESIFAQIDAGKTKLENVRKMLKQIKQSVQKLELDTLEKYKSKKLVDVCTKITDGSHNSPSNSSTHNIPYVTAKNIRPRKLDFTNITYVTTEDHQEIFSRCNPEKGDVLYTKDGTVGYAVVNECDFEFSLLSSVALLKPIHTILDSYYLEIFLNNPITYNSIIEKMSGTALRRIILKRIKEILIPLPPLNEQKRIVVKIESIFGRIDANFIKTRIIKLIHNYDYFA